MKLVLKNKKDIKKFYRRLFLYKSFLFRFISFDVITDDKNIKLIVDGLNIKKRKDRINYIYDTACTIIDKHTEGLNICGFKNTKCYIQQCKNNNYTCGCCRKCRYKTDKGCPSKNLACKLFNCSEVKKRYDVLEYKDLKILKLLNMKNRFIVKSDYFSLREDVLKDLYSYTMTYSTIRIVYRFIKNYFYSQQKK